MAKVEQLKTKPNPRINRYFSEGLKRHKVEEIEKNISTVSVLICEICGKEGG